MKNLILVSLIVLSSTAAYAWDGKDRDTGNRVRIDEGNLIREGETVRVS